MIDYKSRTGLCFGIVLLIQAITWAGACHIERDTQSCPESIGINYFRNELKCLMQQNDLKTIMECVKKDNGANIDDEGQICLDADNGDGDSDDDEEEDDDFDFFDSEYFDDEFYNVGEQICLKPRTIMIRGPPAVDGAAALIGISGTLASCPYGNVNFHKCLCATGVGRNSIVKLSAYFKNGYIPELTCTQSLRKRTDFLGDIIHKPHMHQARDNSWGDYVHKVRNTLNSSSLFPVLTPNLIVLLARQLHHRRLRPPNLLLRLRWRPPPVLRPMGPRPRIRSPRHASPSLLRPPRRKRSSRVPHMGGYINVRPGIGVLALPGNGFVQEELHTHGFDYVAADCGAEADGCACRDAHVG
jgi:hypothetical protein